MTDPIAQKDKDFVTVAIKVLLLLGVLASAYVILKSCSTPKTGIERFATGSLSKLVSLETPPVMPGLKFTAPNGEQTNLQALRGEPIIVNIWATWCPPCVAELPSLNTLSRDYQGRLKVVAISVDQNAQTAQAFLDKIKAGGLPLYHDKTWAIASEQGLGARGIPLTVIYNASGREIARLQGEADWQSQEAVRLLDYISEP